MNLGQQILIVLGRVQPHGLSESTLRDELRIRMGGRRPGQLDTESALFRLESQGYVAKATNDLTDDTEWSITEEGAKK